MRKSRLLQLVFYALTIVLLLACRLTQREATPAEILNPGDTTRTLTHDGQERTYGIHTPPDYDATQSLPVVLVFHGGGGNADNIQRMTGFSTTADAHGFIVVYPSGSGRLKNKLLTWNAGTCCDYAVRENVDDVGFVKAILADLSTIANVDAQRIYATGMSNGAMMAYRLGCELSDVIAAIGPVAGTQNISPCEPSHPVPVIHVHGDSDQHVPFDGGVGEQSLSGVDFTSVPDSIAFWAKNNDCDIEGKQTQSGNLIHTTFKDCRQNAAVELYTVIGGLHAWPGGEAGWQNGDEPTQKISANDLMWRFFEAHPKTQP